LEENGDSYEARCLLRGDLTEIGGEARAIHYLNHRYGERVVCLTAQAAVLDIPNV